MKTALSAVAVAAVLAFAPLAGGTFAAADNSAQRHSRFSPEDRAAFLDARIAALKAGLELNADQEKNWPPLESAMRDLAKERAARFAAWRERDDGADRAGEVNPIDRLTRASERLSARAADLQKLAAPPSRSTTVSMTARSAGSPCFSTARWAAAIGATGAARAEGRSSRRLRPAELRPPGGAAASARAVADRGRVCHNRARYGAGQRRNQWRRARCEATRKPRSRSRTSRRARCRNTRSRKGRRGSR